MKTKEQINEEFDEVYDNPISSMWTENFTNKLKSHISSIRSQDLSDILEWVEGKEKHYKTMLGTHTTFELEDKLETLSDIKDFLTSNKKNI